MAKKFWQLSANDTVAEEEDLVGKADKYSPPFAHAIEVPTKFNIDGNELAGPSVQGDGRVRWEWTDGSTSALHVFYDPATDTFSGGVEGEGGMNVYKEGLAQAVAWAKGSGGEMTVVESNNNAGTAFVVATGETAIVTVTAPDPVARKSDVVGKADASVSGTKTLTVPEMFEFDATYMTDTPFVTQDGKVRWETSSDDALFVEYDPATDTFIGGDENEGFDDYVENLEEALAAAENGDSLTKSAEGAAVPAPVVYGITSVTITTSDPVARKSDLASLDAGAIKSGTLDPARLPVRSFTFSVDPDFHGTDKFTVYTQVIADDYPRATWKMFKDTHTVAQIKELLPTTSSAYAVLMSAQGHASGHPCTVSVRVDGVLQSFTLEGAGAYYGFVTLAANRTLELVSIAGTETGDCLLEGTRILLADGTERAVEDVGYGDELAVWDFGACRRAVAKPLWVRRRRCRGWWFENVFSDGTVLKTTGRSATGWGHRGFNLTRGSFTYFPASVGDMFLKADGSAARLVSSTRRESPAWYRNIITDGHMNCYANGVLTSCSLNNYRGFRPMDMRFKDPAKVCHARGEFDGLPDGYIDGLHLCENPAPAAELVDYVKRLLVRAADRTEGDNG